MTPIKEPNIDFSKKSEPWTEKELSEFRKVMQEIKSKNSKTRKGHPGIEKQQHLDFKKMDETK